MGIFDGREKALEATVASLRIALAETERSNNVLVKTAKESSEQIIELRKMLENNRAKTAALEQRLADRNDLPEKNLAAIRIFVRGLGGALLCASIAFAVYLALGKGYAESRQLIWSLYIFTQFIGMYLLGFGAHTTLRSLSLLGSYMSTVTVISAVAIGMTVMKYANLLDTDQLVALGGVNALGVPLLIYVERRRALTAPVKS
ncbi:MAG: hypothetical protein AB1584_14760 [Pseudomonadota bacterium]